MALVEENGTVQRRRDGAMVVLPGGISIYLPMGTEAGQLPAGTMVKVLVLAVREEEEGPGCPK